ncbi:hypothetical protein AWB78_08272 [Caballeronia calidae]|uniref:Uncharacterized protein n=1 Tax=Caballeronia calidae TaxID=1777139 RepID=A0A158EJ45_9BURK|nr:hypothetical protein AWB78_08272 [Caballeronia calidae]
MAASKPGIAAPLNGKRSGRHPLGPMPARRPSSSKPRARIGDTVTTERRHYFSSLPRDVARVAHAVRSHWAIENGVGTVVSTWPSAKTRVVSALRTLHRSVSIRLAAQAKNRCAAGNACSCCHARLVGPLKLLCRMCSSTRCRTPRCASAWATRAGGGAPVQRGAINHRNRDVRARAAVFCGSVEGPSKGCRGAARRALAVYNSAHT